MRKNILRAVGGPGVIWVDSQQWGDVAGDWSQDISFLSFESGDIGLLFEQSSAVDTNNTIAGWTPILNLTRSGSSDFTVYVRTMDGTETTVASTNGASLDSVSCSISFWRGCSEPTAGNISSIENSQDPPASAISVVPKDMVIVAATNERFATTGGKVTAVPSGYTSEAVVFNSDPNDTSLVVGSKSGLSGTVNPGAFTYSGNADGCACTLVLQYA